MIKHVHEWEIKRQGLGRHITISCECGEELTIEQAEALLNAFWEKKPFTGGTVGTYFDTSRPERK